MNEREKQYEKTNDEATALLKLMAEEMDPKKIEQLDKQCALKLRELRGMIKTI